MRIFDFFKSKARKDFEARTKLEAWYICKGYTPCIFGTQLHKTTCQQFKLEHDFDLTPQTYITLQICRTMDRSGIDLPEGKFSVVVAIPGVAHPLHLEPKENMSLATIQASEFILMSPRPIYGLYITQRPMSGHVNINCYDHDALVYTIMLCSENED